MAFDNDDVRAPAGLRTDEFLLRPIRASDAELDHEAVMESKAFLRRWEQSSWPEDDFTVDANRDDLVKLERRHAAGEFFTYTVMNPTETRCLGCVYILPTAARVFTRAQITALGGAQWSAYEAGVYFWIRKSRLSDVLDRRLLDALGPWLAHEWRIEHHLIVTNEQFEQQVAMIEGAGLELRFRRSPPPPTCGTWTPCALRSAPTARSNSAGVGQSRFPVRSIPGWSYARPAATPGILRHRLKVA